MRRRLKITVTTSRRKGSEIRSGEPDEVRDPKTTSQLPTGIRSAVESMIAMAEKYKTRERDDD